MFLYHWELVPVTGSSSNSVPLSTNQTGRGISFLLFLPVTTSSISVSFAKLDFRLSIFILARSVEPVSGVKKGSINGSGTLFNGWGAEGLKAHFCIV